MRRMPTREKTIPSPAMTMGRRMGESPPKLSPVATTSRPSTMVARMVATYEPKRSAPIPATSPTLSPTLSAMVAGLRGSSSGMPTSTLPTRSAPTAAAHAGEERHALGAEREAGEHLQRALHLRPVGGGAVDEEVVEEDEEGPEPEDREPRHAHPHHRPTGEGDRQRAGEAGLGGLRG